jgi:hypothetical protein
MVGGIDKKEEGKKYPPIDKHTLSDDKLDRIARQKKYRRLEQNEELLHVPNPTNNLQSSPNIIEEIFDFLSEMPSTSAIQHTTGKSAVCFIMGEDCMIFFFLIFLDRTFFIMELKR